MTDSDKRQIIVTNSQIGVIGDGNTIYGGIHFYQYLAPQPVDEATLNAALERLAAMPVDRLSDPDALPPGSRMIFRRNPLFVGREADLLRLGAVLKGGSVAAIGQIAAATGLGGIGKTQLATEFVHRYGQFFAGGVFWLSFADPRSVPAEIAACGGPGALDLRPDFGNLPLEDQVCLVLSAWCGPLPRLLIFDNCEDEDLLARWLPPGGGARVLVTSRRGQWNAELGVTALRLDVLPRAESVALLRKHRPDLSDADADEIAEELGDLPLALHVAGSFLATYRHAAFGAPQAYLADLRREGLAHSSLSNEKKNYATAHELHVARTFALSYERLNPENPTDAVALALLARSAYFAPGVPIPRALLLATLTPPDPEEPAEIQNQKSKIAEDALARLVALGLLDLEGNARPVLHRLLAAFVRDATGDDAVTAAEAQDAVEQVVLAQAHRLNEAGYPAALLAWQPHLRFVTDAAQAREDERAAVLCNELGYHLKMTGDYPGARFYLERTLAIREATLGSNHPDTALSLNNFGWALQSLGDLVGARPYLERALAIREATLGHEHPDTATSLNNLGYLLQSMGDLVGAQPYLESALALREVIFGLDHPNTARSLHNLGGLLRDLGNLTEAQIYLERAWVIHERTFGSESLYTATSLNSLGYLLQLKGDLAGARPYYERALAIREAALGPEHPDTATSLNNLALLCAYEGNFAEAVHLMRRALAIFATRLGPDHPNTQRSRQSLAAIEADLQASNADAATED